MRTILPTPLDREGSAGEDAAPGEFQACCEPSPTPATTQEHRESLTPDEHAEVQVAAYYRALERGGGWLPPYEPAQAVEDFCWAAERVLQQRVGG